MNYEYMVNGIDLSFTLIREIRKTLTLSISKEGVLIAKSPLFMNVKEIKIFISKNVSWIEKKRKSILELKEIPNDNNYENGSKIFYLGTEYKLKIEQNLVDRVLIEDDIMIVLSTKPKNQIHVRKKLESWYKDKAKEIFNERLYECLAYFPDLKVPDLIVKKMKRRWGSYSSKHQITLNLKLIKTPKRCIDYVMTHELCHAYHMNHGKEFKRLLISKIQNWKEIKRELNLYTGV